MKYSALYYLILMSPEYDIDLVLQLDLADQTIRVHR